MKVKNNKQVLFTKMRLVPLTQRHRQLTASERDAAEYRLRKRDPLISRMVDVLGDIKRPRSIRGKTTKAGALAIQNASIARFNALNALRNSVNAPNTTDAPSMSTEPTIMPDVGDVQVPSSYNKKLSTVFKYISDNPGEIAKTSSDELVIDGLVQRGTSFSKAMRALFVDYKTSTPGTRQLVQKLQSLGLPQMALSSKLAKSYFIAQAGSGLWPGKRGRILRVY